MASPIDQNRRDHFEALQIQKRRADKINQSCFIIICVLPLISVIELILAIASWNGGRALPDLIGALCTLLSVVCAFIGCIRRYPALHIAAVVLFILGFLISKSYQQAFVLLGLCLYLLPYGFAAYAGFIEQRLRQEEGYPQFDLSLEEKILREQLEQQTSEKTLAAKRAAASQTDMDSV